jgi:hypothetical protein
MAEQDRPDAVPAVLNDLMDVDGTPSEGDGLSFTDGAWRPGVAAGLLPESGPALTVFDGESTGSRSDNIEIGEAWGAIPVAQKEGYEAYPGVHPPMGAWSSAQGLGMEWRATEPGVYTVYTMNGFALSAAWGANSAAYLCPPIPLVSGQAWGADRTTAALAPGQLTVFRTDHLTLFISQGMIDAGWGGFCFRAPAYTPHGAERVNLLYVLAVIERHSPGSAFDYYGDI